MDWLLVLGLEEGLVGCATLCVKSWVILGSWLTVAADFKFTTTFLDFTVFFGHTTLMISTSSGVSLKTKKEIHMLLSKYVLKNCDRNLRRILMAYAKFRLERLK
jgi:hypothetical protein